MRSGKPARTVWSFTSRALVVRTFVAVAGVMIGPTPRDAAAQRSGAQRDTVRSDTAAVQHLERAVVTGTRLSPVSTRTGVRADPLPVRGAAPGPTAAADALAALPGVSVTDDQGSRVQPTLSVRGFTLSPVIGVPQGLSVFLDGVRINEPDAQEVNFDLIPMNAVSSATLIRGPAALFGKNSLAGALVLSTRRGGPTPSLNASVEAGAFGMRGATVTASGTGSGGALRGIDGYLMASGTDERGWRDATDARTRMIFANAGRKRDSSDVAVTAMYAHDRVFLAGSLPESWLSVDPRANYTGGDFFEPDLLHLALRGTRSFPAGTLRGNVFFRRNNIEQLNVNVDAPTTRALIANRSGGATAEWSAPSHLAGYDLAMTVGAEYSRNDVGYRTYAEPASLQSIPSDCDQSSGLCEHARVPEDDASLYAQGLLNVSPKVALTAAARGDYVRIPFRDLLDPGNDGTSVFRRVSPRISATFRFDPRTSGYASVSAGFRAPAALELACADENAPCSLPSALGDDPPLAPVTVRTYEVGVDRYVTRDARIGISAYRTDVHDDILFVASTLTAGFFRNIPRTRREGIELTGEAALPAGFRARASYNYLDATYQSTVALASELKGNVATPGDRFPLSPTHQTTMSIGNTHAFRSSVLGLHLSLKAVSSQFLRGDDANRERPLPGYATTGAWASWQTAQASLKLYVTNLFNRTYESFGVFGRNPSGPIGEPIPEQPVLERFLTPGYPRTMTLSVSIHS